MDNIFLADNIQKLRKKSGLTQEELAEKIGVTFQAVSKWETRQCYPDVETIVKMAELFNLSLDKFLLGNVEKSETNTDDERILNAIKNYDEVTVSRIQREFNIGHSRAKRILERLNSENQNKKQFMQTGIDKPLPF